MEGRQDGYSPEEYLGLISDLTPKELVVALSLYRVQPEMRDEPWKAWKDQIQTELHLDESDLSIALSRVASSGLIELLTTGSDEGGFWISSGEPGDPGYYRVAPAFEKLMRFLFPA